MTAEAQAERALALAVSGVPLFDGYQDLFRVYLSDALLLIVLVEDGGAVLRAHVVALPVGRRWVVYPVEVLHLRAGAAK